MKKTVKYVLRIAVTCMAAVMLYTSYADNGAKKYSTVSAAGSRPLYMFNVMGDMQIGDPNIYDEENYKNSLEQIKSLSPESKAILTVGDHTNNGSKAAYDILKKTKESVLPDIPMYYAIGNHDRGYQGGYGDNNTDPKVWRNRFIEYAKISSGYDKIDNVYYSFMLENSYVIILGSEVTSRNDYCNDVFVSDTQYKWFENEMKKAGESGNPIYVIFHEPFYNTVSGSLPGQNWNGNPANPNYYANNRYNDLKNIADKYPQTIVFSGHTHWAFSTKQPVLLTDGKTRATYVNCASVGYLWYDNNTGKKDSSNKWTGSEGLFVYVYEDRIELKGRDFINNKWVLEQTVPVAQAAGAVTQTTPPTPSTPTSAPTQTQTQTQTTPPATATTGSQTTDTPPQTTAPQTEIPDNTAESDEPTATVTDKNTAGTGMPVTASPAYSESSSPAASSGNEGHSNTALIVTAVILSAGAVTVVASLCVILIKAKKG